MRARAWIFAILYLGVIGYLSLYPGRFLDHPQSSDLVWAPLAGRRKILDAVLNFLFYLPLGYSLTVAGGGRNISAFFASLSGIALSYTIERCQLWTEFRYGTYSDWFMNSAGSICASVAAVRTQALLQDPKLKRHYEAWSLAGVPALFLMLWLLWQAFPFVPRIALATTIHQLTHPAPWSWADFVNGFAGFLVLRQVLGRSPWILACLLTVPAQLILIDHTFSIALTVGASIGWLLATNAAVGPRFMASIAITWLCADYFRPFHFTATPAAFSWIPFNTWFESSGTAYYSVFFRKMFSHAAVFWALEAVGLSRLTSGIVLVAIVALGEAAQTILPGRTPESTDFVLAVAVIVLFSLVESRRPVTT